MALHHSLVLGNNASVCGTVPLCSFFEGGLPCYSGRPSVPQIGELRVRIQSLCPQSIPKQPTLAPLRRAALPSPNPNPNPVVRKSEGYSPVSCKRNELGSRPVCLDLNAIGYLGSAPVSVTFYSTQYQRTNPDPKSLHAC